MGCYQQVSTSYNSNSSDIWTLRVALVIHAKIAATGIAISDRLANGEPIRNEGNRWDQFVQRCGLLHAFAPAIFNRRVVVHVTLTFETDNDNPRLPPDGSGFRLQPMKPNSLTHLSSSPIEWAIGTPCGCGGWQTPTKFCGYSSHTRWMRSLQCSVQCRLVVSFPIWCPIAEARRKDPHVAAAFSLQP